RCMILKGFCLLFSLLLDHPLSKCSYDCPIKHYTSTYGAQCSDACEDRGSDYYWCNTREGWDYCSPYNNVDYKGNTCHKDYPCSKDGQDYYWCYLEKGGWDYCAQVLPKTMTHYTRYQEECINACQYQKNGDYYWCYTQDNSWDYCSPQADFTYKLQSCRPDHNCGTRGKSYSWCYTTYDDDWDYCGFTHFDGCMYSQQRRRKRSPNNPNKVCKWKNNNINKYITVTQEDAQNTIASCTGSLRNEALGLIERWDNQLLPNQPRSNLVHSENFRIDLQGFVNVNNQRCYNLQVQRNKPRSKGESTTVSQVICPIDIPNKTLRWAFGQSLRNRSKIKIITTNE
uniref:Uncharacterized protein n=1 Tax=Seriola lalandi dorsalis TaxID=1841481 RepID=A0A3B4XMN4_SERLL